MIIGYQKGYLKASRYLKSFLFAVITVWLTSCQSTPVHTASNDASGFGGTGKIIAQNDQEPTGGFGGTGIQLGKSSSGYGNTVFIGTITAFGSIWVNGVEIEYPKTANISSDLTNQSMNTRQLKIGQQVVLTTRKDDAHTVTDAIKIYYPFAGKVQKREAHRIQINNTWVKTNALTHYDSKLNVSAHDFIAINAYQANNGEWIATRISNNPDKTILNLPKLTSASGSQSQRIIVQTGLNALLSRQRIRSEQLEIRPLSETPMPLKRFQAGSQLPVRQLQQIQQKQSLQREMQLKQLHQNQRQLQQELIKQQKPSVKFIKPLKPMP